MGGDLDQRRSAVRIAYDTHVYTSPVIYRIQSDDTSPSPPSGSHTNSTSWYDSDHTHAQQCPHCGTQAVPQGLSRHAICTNMTQIHQ